MEKKEWCDRTERMVFKWKDKDQDRSSVWTAGVRNAIRTLERSGEKRGETSEEQSSRQVEASPSGKRGGV